jgi:hypothetical protein
MLTYFPNNTGINYSCNFLKYSFPNKNWNLKNQNQLTGLNSKNYGWITPSPLDRKTKASEVEPRMHALTHYIYAIIYMSAHVHFACYLSERRREKRHTSKWIYHVYCESQFGHERDNPLQSSYMTCGYFSLRVLFNYQSNNSHH